MKKLRVIRNKSFESPRYERGQLQVCVIENKKLETGERLRRGCGFRGMVDCSVGRHCLYCGNIIYYPDSNLGSLWFHFKTGREYWKASHRHTQDFINGIPVDAPVERIPRSLLSDLDEPAPPDWFFYYVVYDEDRFLKYLESRAHAR
ncbi:hypothetical protein UR09_03060 [Candidatus Nitromaritima sp. SCGC AAA799-A02]|nr:hypothetical protein UZ36_06670 [Candidatus Nitromaritima sp. SCGC AAA799-C22]KMP11532.1 hypothetical protein UR09_03060 [Candidatus Nitromaritima sp. SCGC AAA799-A02]